MAQLKAGVEVRLLTPVPVAHERNLPFFEVAETAPGESLRHTRLVLFVNGELRVVGGGVRVVIAVLVVEHEGKPELAAGVRQTLQAFPSSDLSGRRQGVRVLMVIP